MSVLERSINPLAVKIREESCARIRDDLIKRSMPPSDVEWCVKHGYYPEREVMYNGRIPFSPLYLTDAERISTYRINGNFRLLLRNKLVSYLLFSNYIRTPKIYASVTAGSIDFTEDLPSGETTLFFKPTKGGGGRGAIRRAFHNGVCTETGKPFLSVLESFGRRHGNVIALENITQCEFMSSLFPDSINTLRFLCYRDPVTRSPRISRGIVRVGTSNTSPVDNFSRGGISFALDLKTGEIGTGRSKKIGGGGENIRFHPDTGKKITGLIVPNINDLVTRMTDILRYVPMINYVGWDVCLSNAGPVLIEANNTTDVDIFQVHEPLLTDGGLVRFYQHYGII